MLIDPGSLEPVPEAREILASLRESAGADGTKEFLASQVEHSSRVFSTLPDALAELTDFRRRLAETAAERGLAAASVGVPFQTTPYPLLTPGDRYEEVEHEFRSVVADHQVNGLHVHVHVPDRESGVRALNRVRAWIPVLLALSGNSPFWRGADTGFCSWRSIILRRWVTAGCPPPSTTPPTTTAGSTPSSASEEPWMSRPSRGTPASLSTGQPSSCLLYTSDAADE